MLIIMNIGLMISRQSDSLNSLGAAALVILVANPYSVGDVGMLLSFAATLGIVLFSDRLSLPVMEKIVKPLLYDYKVFYKTAELIVSTVCVTISATLATLPISSLAFGGVSTVSVFVNLLVIPFMSVVLVAIALCILAHFIPFADFLCSFISGFVSFFYDYLVFICNAFTSLPYSYVYTDKPYFYFWISSSLVLAAVAILFNKRFVTLLSVMLSVLILCTGVMNYSIACKSRITVHIPYTGKGLSVLVESSDGYAVLKVGGYKSKYYVLSDKITRMNSHNQNVLVETSGNNSNVLYTNLTNEFDYNKILRYYNKESTAKENTSESQNTVQFSDVHILNLWDKAEITLIPADNDVFEYLKAGDKTVLIAPRDADCSLIPSQYTSADVIITDGIPYDYTLLSCDTLYVTGTGYASDAAQEVLMSISQEVFRVNDFSFDIDI